MRTMGIRLLVMVGAITVFAPPTQASRVPDQNGLRASADSTSKPDSRCSNGSLLGSFGFTADGTLLALPPPFAGPFAEVGRQTFDGRGNTDATATLSANGNIVRVTVQGTYVVNAHCTGSMSLYVLPFGTTATFDFVIDDDGAELRAIAADTGAVESRVYKKQFSRGRED